MAYDRSTEVESQLEGLASAFESAAVQASENDRVDALLRRMAEEYHNALKAAAKELGATGENIHRMMPEIVEAGRMVIDQMLVEYAQEGNKIDSMAFGKGLFAGRNAVIDDGP